MQAKDIAAAGSLFADNNFSSKKVVTRIRVLNSALYNHSRLIFMYHLIQGVFFQTMRISDNTMTIIIYGSDYISLKDALRFVLYSNGEIGQRVASNWYNITNASLSRGEIDIFRACALRLFTWLEAGKIEAAYIPDGQIEDVSIRRSTWGCHGVEAVRWELSAIRPPGHRPINAPQIENIKLSGEDLERLISQPTSATKVIDPFNNKTKTRNQLLVLKIVDELASEGTYIDESISNSMTVNLIQNRLSQKRAAGDKAVPELSRETILRALDRR